MIPTNLIAGRHRDRLVHFPFLIAAHAGRSVDHWRRARIHTVERDLPQRRE